METRESLYCKSKDSSDSWVKEIMFKKALVCNKSGPIVLKSKTSRLSLLHIAQHSLHTHVIRKFGSISSLLLNLHLAVEIEDARSYWQVQSYSISYLLDQKCNECLFKVKFYDCSKCKAYSLSLKLP